MAADHIDLTTAEMSDDSDDGPDHARQAAQGPQPHSTPQSGSRTRKPISPPALSRQATVSLQGSVQGDVTPALTTSPPRANRGSAQKVADGDAKPPVMPNKTAVKSQGLTSPAQSTQQHNATSQRTPKGHRADWNVEKVEESLRKFATGIGTDGAKFTSRLLRASWKDRTAERQSISKKNWFTGMKLLPAEPGINSMKIKTKHMGPGRTGKQEKRDHYRVLGIKTDRLRVPNYNFHHVEITKNILSPNTMLNFVPHLRDLADEEEPKYRRWLENLESMDKTSGFATLSRQEKVHKTCQKERATTLLIYLDTWLDALAIESCSKPTLIRYMASQTDAVTPQQKSSILNSYSQEVGSPRSSKAVSMFTEAFDRVFNDKDIWKEGAVTLRDVLLLDKSVDTIVDPKKWMKDTPSQVKHVEENSTVETFLETYALLGCLVCCSHSCEHGEYGVDNERKRFSVEAVGGLEQMLRKTSMKAAKNTDSDSTKGSESCGPECYLKTRPGTRARGWSETEVMQLRSLLATLARTKIPVQCATAVFTGRPCWDVARQLEKMDLPLPMSSPAIPIKAKSVHWYDRNRKMLLADWQDQTITHEHHRRDHFDPCNHDGPCNGSNCPCVKAGVMCERFCRCTAATCATKFTGCACHSLGKTCLPKQKERPCICVQLNRECDPSLCGSCGAYDRANPRNADDDELFMHGCQNCAMQRGKSKSLVLGKSMIENCGYGLFAAEDIAQDEFVIEYVGELISQDEGVRREARRGDVFDEGSNSSYLFTLLEQEGIWVDAAIYGNLSRYINHQDEDKKHGLGCNITPKILYVGGEYRIKFTATRDIKAGEELFFNYGENFPNLTKKLLDEQDEEEKSKRRRARKAKFNVEEKKPNGVYKGKKRGRKPKKKAFARVESDPESEIDETMEEVVQENPFDHTQAKSRKRPRGNSDSEEEEEYRPENLDSDAVSIKLGPAKPRGRKQKARKPPGRRLFGRVVNRSEDESEQEFTPQRRGRKIRRLDNEGHGDMDMDVDQQMMGGSMRGGGSGNRFHSHDRDGWASPPHEDTPSRGRTRRRRVGDGITSSPPFNLDPAFDKMDLDTDTSEVKPAPPRKRRGRPPKVPRVEVVDETSDYGAGEADRARDRNEEEGSTRSDGSPYSDGTSDSVIDRSRVRRKPARYVD